MSDGTKIEWTDATWNPITGCSVISPGCANCYAMKLAGTRLRNHPSREGLTRETKAGPVWNGRLTFNEEWLTQPLKWKRPRRIFVCAHGDLFHEDIPDEWIDQVFAVMALSSRHTFQVLTKRPHQMKGYFSVGIPALAERWQEYMFQLQPIDTPEIYGRESPLRNVWLGVSVEDQKRADERIPLLFDIPAAVRFLSAEPLLGPIDLWGARYRYPDGSAMGAVTQWKGTSIDWVIVGGESGKGARPVHPHWIASLRDQCIAAGVPFLFKQWGEWSPYLARGINSSEVASVGEGLEKYQLVRVGKKAAGRILDGREWNEFPDARAS